MNTSFETYHNKEEWLTPPDLLKKLGVFDLDPCSPINRPWDTAKHHFTKKDNGLNKNWFGRVWCNPPYGNQTKIWLEKCSAHENAIALTFARTDTKMFYDHVWQKASAILFIKGRLKFYKPTGEIGSSAGAPSVLIAYGNKNTSQLRKSKIKGLFIQLK